MHNYNKYARQWPVGVSLMGWYGFFVDRSEEEYFSAPHKCYSKNIQLVESAQALINSNFQPMN